jgi:hypothetical protein
MYITPTQFQAIFPGPAKSLLSVPAPGSTPSPRKMHFWCDLFDFAEDSGDWDQVRRQRFWAT